MIFYLGTHMPGWMRDTTVPLFVSHRRLRGYRQLPTCSARWSLDSGAFTEVSTFGRFETTPAEYVTAVRRYRDEIGSLDWAAPQDHMCEPWVLARSEVAGTVLEAQRWTVDNYLTLRAIADDLPIIPVLQGQTVADYVNHVDQYAAAGVNLEHEPIVGVGSVCRRQATAEIAEIIATLSTSIRLHGFGVKSDGIARYGWMLASADSMAWSYAGRRIHPCPIRDVKNCANCRHHALAWRTRTLTHCGRRANVQLTLGMIT